MAQKIVSRLLFIWLLLFGYVVLHEGGHALAVLIFGGHVTHFNVNLLNAHTSYSGDFTEVQKSLIHAGGFVLPYAIWFGAMLGSPKRASSVAEHVKVYSAAIIGSAIPGVIIPLLSLLGKAPEGTDEFKLLQASSLRAPVISLLYLGAIVAGILVWRWKTNNPLDVYLGKGVPLHLGKRTPTVLVIFAIASALSMAMPWVDTTDIVIGDGFERICRAELDKWEGSDMEMCKFWLDEPQDVGIVIVQKDVSANLIDMRLVGPNGLSINLFHAEGYSANQNVQQESSYLEAGEYRFMYDVAQAEGSISIYLRKNW